MLLQEDALDKAEMGRTCGAQFDKGASPIRSVEHADAKVWKMIDHPSVDGFRIDGDLHALFTASELEVSGHEVTKYLRGI